MPSGFPDRHASGFPCRHASGFLGPCGPGIPAFYLLSYDTGVVNATLRAYQAGALLWSRSGYTSTDQFCQTSSAIFIFHGASKTVYKLDKTDGSVLASASADVDSSWHGIAASSSAVFVTGNTPSILPTEFRRTIKFDTDLVGLSSAVGPQRVAQVFVEGRRMTMDTTGAPWFAGTWNGSETDCWRIDPTTFALDNLYRYRRNEQRRDLAAPLWIDGTNNAYVIARQVSSGRAEVNRFVGPGTIDLTTQEYFDPLGKNQAVGAQTVAGPAQAVWYTRRTTGRLVKKDSTGVEVYAKVPTDMAPGDAGADPVVLPASNAHQPLCVTVAPGPYVFWLGRDTAGNSIVVCYDETNDTEAWRYTHADSGLIYTRSQLAECDTPGEGHSNISTWP